MNKWSFSSIDKMCRVCMIESEEFQPIFTSVLLPKEGSSMHLSEMISNFSNVQITLGDGLPEKICNNCAEDTINFYLFKIKCEETDTFLREKLIGQIVDCRIEKAEKEMDHKALSNAGNQMEIDQEERIKSLSNDILLSNFGDEFFDHPDDSSSYSVPSPKETCELTIKSPEKIKDFVCNVCEKRFSREDLLMRHKIAHAKKMDSDKIALETDLEDDIEHQPNMDDIPETQHTIHMKPEQIEVTEEYEKLYPCEQCNLIYIHPEDLVEHATVHQNSVKRISHPKETHTINSKEKSSREEILCETCNKKFKKLSHLRRHMRAHKVLKNFICDKCGKGFMRKEYLQSHIKSHEGVRPHTCQICFKGFNQISNLKDHIRTHNGEKPFLCSTCGKGFNQLGNLRQHTIRHSGVKPHTCSTCGHSFASKGELGAHFRKHTGVRPFVCNVCNNGFTTSSSLVKHKRIHSGEKPYSCDVCHVKFSRSGILSRHKRIHTGEKPYICSFCQKAFTQSNDLNSHLRIHTGEKPFICDECGQAFRQNSALKAHKKTHKKRDKKSLELSKLDEENADLKRELKKCSSAGF